MKPRLLDLFCGAGGSAVGYHRAGFDVVGVDNRPQPHYPFRFIQADAFEHTINWLDALEILERTAIWDFDAVHASPPCQRYAGATAWRGNRDDHPDLIEATRELLLDTGLPYVIENVPDARHHLVNPTVISGDDVGLPITRRRFFETNWPLDVFVLATRHEHRAAFDHGATVTESEYRDLMGCEWMTAVEARQAIPPAYTELIGHQLLQRVRVAA